MADQLQTKILSNLDIRSPGKRTNITSALSSNTGSIFAFGFDRDGTGISNHMIVQNHTDSSLILRRYYIEWGNVRVAPDAVLPSHYEDECLFQAAGGWCATGSSGIVTYRLDDDTFLHILWSCPYNFNHYCNFIGLYLCGVKDCDPTSDLFHKMLQNIENPGIIPKQHSPYDLVCCGPGNYTSSPTGTINWGEHRPCDVTYGQYYVTMTMGDNHKTSSTVTVFKTKPLD